MPENTERLWLSDAIHYEQDISPYNIVEVISGVGSGKNHWVEKVLMKQYHVLLITSRKAKVEETRTRTGYDRNLTARTIRRLQEGQYDGFADASECNIICNNSHIEAYLKYLYKQSHETVPLWDLFDLIVVDEVHSMATDATFSDAPFHVMSFLRAAYRNSNTKIILMTATPKSVEEVLPRIYTGNPKICDSVYKDDRIYFVKNYTEICKDVSPKKVGIDFYEKQADKILSLYRESRNTPIHVIYFVNRKKKMLEMLKYFTQQGIPEEKIAISFSDQNTSLVDEEGNEIFSEATLARKEYTEEYMKNHEDLPPEIFLFITTSKNKEGINIMNEKFRWHMITESHYVEDIKQMWGRVRCPLDKMIIVYNAEQYSRKYCSGEPEFLICKNCLEDVNEAFAQYLEKHKNSLEASEETILYRKATPFIEYAEKTFPYIRFDIVEENFKAYIGRVLGNRAYAEGLDNFDEYCRRRNQNPQVPVNFSIFEQEVYWRRGLENAEENDDYITDLLAKRKLKRFLEDNGLLNVPINREAEEIIMNFIYEDIGIRTSTGGKYSALNSALGRCGFRAVDTSHHADRRKIIQEITR